MRTHKRNRSKSAHGSSASQNASYERAERDAAPERQCRSGDRQSRDRHQGTPLLQSGANQTSLPSHLSSLRGARAFLTHLSHKPTPFMYGSLVPVLVFVLLACAAGLLFAQNGDTSPLTTVAGPGNSNPATPSAVSFDPVSLAVQLGAVVALIFVNAVFAIAEYALITVRPTRIQQLVEENNRSAVMVMHLLEHKTRMMATIQTGVTLIATLSSALAATSAVTPLAQWLRLHGPLMIAKNASTAALIMVTLPVAILSLVIGEIAPKSLAVRHSERFALIAVYPISWLQTLLTPAVIFLTALSNLVVRPFGGTASFTPKAVDDEEIKLIIEDSEVEPVEKEMIHSILDLSDTVVRKVMTPRIDLTAYDVDAPMPGLVRLINDSGHSRIPVYKGDLDNIVGIVHAKDLLNLPATPDRDLVPIQQVMRPPYFIPETKKVDELLSEFRRTRQQLAILRDEYGITAGLVTIEDLLEEIVGDIQDEYDTEEPMVQVLNSHTSILDGRMGISDVNDRMDLDLPEDEADTIGGFVFGLLGHQAEQGEQVRYDGVDFVVEATDGRRITKVRLVRLPHLHEEVSHESSVPASNSTAPMTYS